MSSKTIEWILRVAVAGEFIGHGVFAVGFPKIAGLSYFAIAQKAQWVGWISQMTGLDAGTAATMLTLVGAFDIFIALVILLRPVRIALLWAAFWGFWTALVRPLVGEPVWDFVERFANWGAPLALLLILGWPHSLKGWFRVRG